MSPSSQAASAWGISSYPPDPDVQDGPRWHSKSCNVRGERPGNVTLTPNHVLLRKVGRERCEARTIRPV
jgi:hypothetical protein